MGVLHRIVAALETLQRARANRLTPSLGSVAVAGNERYFIALGSGLANS
jgi:hypothetical protein